MEDFIANSLCKDCIFRVSRVISTEGLDLVDYDGNDLEDNISELYNELCSKLCIDLDHVVLECSLYKSKYNIADYFFTNGDIFNLTKNN